MGWHGTGDFNLDKINDIATADALSDVVSVLIGLKGGVFYEPVCYPVGPRKSSPDPA